jgi:hypothetical protein
MITLELLPFVDSNKSVNEPMFLKCADLNLMDISKKDQKIFSIAPVAKIFLDREYQFNKLKPEVALRYARNNYSLYQQTSGQGKGNLFQKCVEYILETSNDDKELFYHERAKQYISFDPHPEDLLQEIRKGNNFLFIPTNKSFPPCDYIHYDDKHKSKK